MRILIVDDDEELTSLLTELLTREGFRLGRHQRWAARGVAAALSGGYDLLILDVMLPGLNGFEILERVRRKAACRC